MASPKPDAPHALDGFGSNLSPKQWTQPNAAVNSVNFVHAYYLKPPN